MIRTFVDRRAPDGPGLVPEVDGTPVPHLRPYLHVAPFPVPGRPWCGRWLRRRGGPPEDAGVGAPQPRWRGAVTKSQGIAAEHVGAEQFQEQFVTKPTRAPAHRSPGIRSSGSARLRAGVAGDGRLAVRADAPPSGPSGGRQQPVAISPKLINRPGCCRQMSRPKPGQRDRWGDPRSCGDHREARCRALRTGCDKAASLVTTLSWWKGTCVLIGVSRADHVHACHSLGDMP
ncbi:hypothetical protein QFZ49_005628 [Streptomyces turgidiscabies]|uniref:Uncharacterized protein n=1 Tax=Streptomyces turgidiscabies TaxID=85558 RepID=A0ABU0RUL8_9ACTN|nr:hypothetical protein [Streptomyces turgidiscabies]